MQLFSQSLTILTGLMICGLLALATWVAIKEKNNLKRNRNDKDI